ncbi:uncharacterized protein BXZ73DRAFT_87581 [Epithele typhae]|uniref:uncharacterized protein n=1 Tax=Epithele typhae TaxID=378194 RepID=UPI00200728D0|nr:uncharacterized protein BXZ73DRAFT_87581 [Epithele typhae]KAH9943193.1 hypothetical protein BXZ73DRAFT_87581 [Epithele typhae]
MSFEHAGLTKGLMVGIALTSIAVGIFDLKHYLNLQLVPHISKHHQYWRLLLHHLVCASSSDLLLTELLLYHAGIPVERAFGSVKYASFFIISILTTMLLSFLAMLVAQLNPITRVFFNNVPPGPIAIMYAALYQYLRLVPPAYHFRIFGLPMSDKVWVYAIAAQLLLHPFPPKLLPAAVGLFVGYLYRSDFLQLKGWRISPRATRFAQAWIAPLLGLGETRPVRRTNRALPEPRAQGGTAHARRAALDEDVLVTTARNARRRLPRTAMPPVAAVGSGGAADDGAAQSTDSGDAPSEGGGGGVVRQWVNELTSGARPGGANVRAPTEAEIGTLTSMFPDVQREVLLGVLQRR